jgi:hypothetical protein
MANTIKLKNSGTAANVPASLEFGELGLNYADGKIYYKNSSNAIVALPSNVTVSDTPPSSPSAGSVWFESDTGKMFVYYDSFWVESSGADGAEGGSITLTTKGDILTRTSSEIERLGVGTNGYFLKANSSTATGLEWGAIPSVSILDDIGDVTITSAASGDLLKWNGTAWVNASGYALLNNPTFTGTVSGISATMVGLGNVTNTSDANKPVSTAQQTALDLKANIASPTFTGTPAAPTATAGTNTTQLATTEFVRTEVANLVASAPATLDTLDELAAALGDDANFATTTATAIGLKANIASPTFTGTPTLPTGTIATTQSPGNNTTAVATTAFVTAGISALVVDPLNNPKFSAIITMDIGV